MRQHHLTLTITTHKLRSDTRQATFSYCKMSTMANLFQLMKTELDKQTTTITEKIMSTIDDKLQPIIEENKCLKIEIEKLNNKVKHLEDKNRKII